MLIPPIGYGKFGTVPHKLENHPNALQYDTEFTLWVGGKTEKNSVFVISANGNEKTIRPEWLPDPVAPKIEKSDDGMTVTTTYSDAAAFEGHKPTGLKVNQTLNIFTDKGYALLNFNVANTGENGILRKVLPLGVIKKMNRLYNALPTTTNITDRFL